MSDPVERRSLPDQFVWRTLLADGTWVLRVEADNVVSQFQAEAKALRECLEAAGAKFHELNLPVYADACLRESRGASDEQEATP